MKKRSRLHLFEAFGVELEYMIVDRDSLSVRPIAEVLLKNDEGAIEGEADQGLIAWSNELVSHVIEIKSNGPSADLPALRRGFVESICKINGMLSAENAVLMPTAAHPWMDPSKETILWPHESQEIYHAYDRIFNCKGHGWSNLQSTHINFPFYDDEEFARLHTAIRFILPIIPALTASSPVLDGKFTGFMDKRLYYYEKNQSRLPILTGRVIPEKLFSRHGYQKHVYDRIASAIKPYDTDNILKPVWLNSRGAMARFDRGAIEIRIIDIQECVGADLAVVALLTRLIKLLVKEQLVSFEKQQAFETEELYQLFKPVIRTACRTVIEHPTYLKAFGINHAVTAKELWAYLINEVQKAYPEEMKEWMPLLKQMNECGSLAERIMGSLSDEVNRATLTSTYRKLIESLSRDELFIP